MLLLWASAISAPLMTIAAEKPLPALTPLHVQMRYDGHFGLLALGRVRVNIDEDPAQYRIHLDTKSRGIASIFSGMKSVAEASGNIDAQHDYIHQHYQSDEDKTHGGIHQRISYDAQGAITERVRNPLDDPNWRPIVPLEHANTAIDPITAYLALRPKLKAMLDKNETDTTLRTYDGARLAEMQIHLVGRTQMDVMDSPMQVIDTTIHRHIIEGYTPKEQKKFAEGDPEIHLYFSDDARLLPVAITFQLGLGELSIELAELKNATD